MWEDFSGEEKKKIFIQTICGIGLKVEPFQLGLSERLEIFGLAEKGVGKRESNGSKKRALKVEQFLGN